MLHIEQITPELTWRLRREILYPSMKLSDMEMEQDTYGMHFGAFKDVKLAAVVSLFRKGDDFQFRKLAVSPEFQHSGIGSQLLEYVTDVIAKDGGKRIWCNARDTAIGFYLKNGYRLTGEKYSKNGFDYEIMEKALSTKTS